MLVENFEGIPVVNMNSKVYKKVNNSMCFNKRSIYVYLQLYMFELHIFKIFIRRQWILFIDDKYRACPKKSLFPPYFKMEAVKIE